ncbi:hypothetical protein HanRHA438_Chr08g0351221 [Helianthus annuus]|uniref:DUF4283 domain-containing protein n=1 Tax=Helianthus annuus TaxID=4232 RepID=A0A9K3IF41_HELAN|nr:hypothetical protein HanXRQr2_Chr08g0339791 [Helianthus annuus]KAJ0538946.1 hypothetical protein HanHA300_Chr08g0280741 [Helianthus annuus]KAJ0546988.1 hypothetical protein HanIR_Chr08g0367051 [Helianthus annuus]KAJ0553590.1 hypothetical protein HanHA89_Chr08g0298091 [Helianthus annuus]KAJ0719251.1 hypothetical protein HanLR1_Chr08g0279641 [Helianthus annuus]
MVENADFVSQADVNPDKASSFGLGDRSRTFNFRDFRSYSDVLGKEKVSGDFVKEAGSNQVVEKLECEKSILVPERTEAFREMFGKAVVGRTVDLETLVDNEASVKRFLDSREIWGPWFSKLEAWRGKSFPLERVVWLRLHGISLHLLEPDVLKMIGDLFGKVLHVPKSLEEDLDLSVNRLGVLAGEAQRIKENVKIKWKNRSYRVWVEEEQDEWIPDCLGFAEVDSPVGSSSLMSSPVVRMSEPGN